jgi:hypothetical protein
MNVPFCYSRSMCIGVRARVSAQDCAWGLTPNARLFNGDLVAQLR